MKRYGADYVLEGISEANFAQWLHHPVTKVWLRFLRDYERQVAQAQVGKLRSSASSPDQFALGRFSGTIDAVSEMAAPSYQSIVEFYKEPEEEKED